MWDELGIAETCDAAAIRRAYAGRLKDTRPDRDPAGFARLRAAYEAALAFAARGADIQTSETDAVVASAETDAAAGVPIPDAAETIPAQVADPKLAVYVAALSRKDVPAAADALEDILRQGHLPIQAEMQLSSWMIELLTFHKDIPPALLVRTAQRFGWHGEGVAAGDPAVERLRSRVEAELWFVRLRKSARSPRVFLGDMKAGAAMLLLGRGPFLISRLFPPQPPLLTVISELQVHGHWLAGRFDSKRLTQVEKLVGSLMAAALRQRTYLGSGGWAILRWRFWQLALLAIPPGILVGMMADGSFAGVVAFQGVRYGLSRYPQGIRTFALCGTLVSMMAIIYLVYEQSRTAGYYGWHNESVDLTVSAPPMVISEYLLDSAGRGDTKAMRTIGELIAAEATNLDETSRAAAWLTAAADRGDVAAMLALNKIYLSWDGLLYNPLLAYKWSGVAAARGRASEVAAALVDQRRAAADLRPSLYEPIIPEIKAWRPRASALPQ